MEAVHPADPAVAVDVIKLADWEAIPAAAESVDAEPLGPQTETLAPKR